MQYEKTKNIGSQNKIISLSEDKQKRTPRPGIQRDFIGRRDIFGIAGLHLQAGIENSDYIIDMIYDALCTPQCIIGCLGEDIGNDPGVQEKIMSLKSGKLAYNKKKKEEMIQGAIHALTIQHKHVFYENLMKRKKREEQRITSFSKNRLISVKENKEKRKEKISTRKKEKNKYQKIINQLDERIPENRKIIEKYQNKLDTITQEKDNYLKQQPLENKSSITIDKERNTIRNNIQNLNNILQNKDTTSSLYTKLYKERSESFRIQATKDVEKKIYSLEEQVFQERVRTRIHNMNEKYTLPNNDNEKYSDAYQKNIHKTKVFINSTTFEASDYFITYINELLQIQLLETQAKIMYPEKNIQAYKAPTVDDITAKADCLMKVDNDYISIDLKTSINNEFLEDQEAKIQEAKPLYATSHALNIEPVAIRNHILAVHPSKTYTLFSGLMKHFHTGTSVPTDIRQLEDSDVYQAIHTSITREHAKQRQMEGKKKHIEKFSSDIMNIIDNKQAA